VYACWERGCLRVLRAWGRLGLIRLPPYGSRHLHDRTLMHQPIALPASQAPRSSTPWKRTTGPTRTAQPTTTGTLPRSGPPGTVTAGTPATPRKLRKGQPLKWAAHKRCPPQDTTTLLHQGEQPAPGSQEAGRSGFSASARLLPAGLGVDGGAPRASSEGPYRAPVRALSTDGPGPSAMPPVAASVLALGHFALWLSCCGDGFPADLPATWARVGSGSRHRLRSRAPRERTRFRCHAAAVAAFPRPPGAPTGEGEVLLFSLRNYRIVASLGLDKLSLVAGGVVVDTGARPFLVRRSSLAPDWLRQVVTSKAQERVRLRDANNARLRTSGTVTLWLQTGARIVPVTFLFVDDLSVPVLLGCTFMDDNAHSILRQDRSIRWTDCSVVAILRGPLEDGDRSMGASCVLRFT